MLTILVIGACSTVVVDAIVELCKCKGWAL